MDQIIAKNKDDVHKFFNSLTEETKTTLVDKTFR